MRVLKFCRDGVLRLHDAVRDRYQDKFYRFEIPLAAMEQQRPGMFLSLLDAEIEIEDGLDVGELLRNLSPWAEAVGALTNCRFDLFLQELDKPAAGDTALAGMSFCVLQYTQCFRAEADFEGKLEFDRIPGTRLSTLREMTPLITDRLGIDAGRWDCAAFRGDTQDFFAHSEDNGYGLSLAALPEWRHLKVRILDHSRFYDETPCSHHLSDKGGIIRAGHPMADEIRNVGGDVLRRFVPVAAPAATLHAAILQGLIWDMGFHGSPDATASIFAEIEAEDGEALSQSLEEIEALPPEQRAAREAEVAAAIEAEERAEQQLYRESPFDGRDRRLLDLLAGLPAECGLRAPDGLPPAVGASRISWHDSADSSLPLGWPAKTICVGGSLEDSAKRVADAWHRTERGERVEPRSVITFVSWPAFVKILTASRYAVLAWLHRHGRAATAAVATGCGREAVEDDLNVLHQHGLVEQDDAGRWFVDWDQIRLFGEE